MRAIDLLSSRSLSIFSCIILVHLENVSKSQLNKAIYSMERNMYELEEISVRQPDNQISTKSFYLTFCSLNCQTINFLCKKF